MGAGSDTVDKGKTFFWWQNGLFLGEQRMDVDASGPFQFS